MRRKMTVRSCGSSAVKSVYRMVFHNLSFFSSNDWTDGRLPQTVADYSIHLYFGILIIC